MRLFLLSTGQKSSLDAALKFSFCFDAKALTHFIHSIHTMQRKCSPYVSSTFLLLAFSRSRQRRNFLTIANMRRELCVYFLGRTCPFYEVLVSGKNGICTSGHSNISVVNIFFTRSALFNHRIRSLSVILMKLSTVEL